MLVTLDVFSGRPNPTWRLGVRHRRELHARLQASPPEVQAARIAPAVEQPRLGFRGFVVSEEVPGELMPSPVPRPSLFAARVAAPEVLLVDQAGATAAAPSGAVAEELDTADWLLRTGPSEVVDEMADTVSGQIDELRHRGSEPSARTGPTASSDASGATGDGELVEATSGEQCRPYLIPMNLAFWNTPSIQPYNNCYNYATNFVSWTRAQPGRRSGRIYRSFDCGEVLAAAGRDGLEVSCDGVLRVVALGIWPGFDFHWWRLHPDGFWAHKVGWWPAQDRDNSSRVIGFGLTPATCDRGPYTQFCGYYFAPLSMWVA